MRAHVNGDWTIVHGEYGIDCGMAWAIFRGDKFVADGFRTLVSAKRHAATLGAAIDGWKAEKVLVRVME